MRQTNSDRQPPIGPTRLGQSCPADHYLSYDLAIRLELTPCANVRLLTKVGAHSALLSSIAIRHSMCGILCIRPVTCSSTSPVTSQRATKPFNPFQTYEDKLIDCNEIVIQFKLILIYACLIIDKYYLSGHRFVFCAFLSHSRIQSRNDVLLCDRAKLVIWAVVTVDEYTALSPCSRCF